MVDFEEFVKDNPSKKIVCIYGNCHTMIVSDILSNDKDFLSDYVIYPIPPIQSISDAGFFEHECFSACDVFILMRQEDSDFYKSEMNCRQPVRADFFS